MFESMEDDLIGAIEHQKDVIETAGNALDGLSETGKAGNILL